MPNEFDPEAVERLVASHCSLKHSNWFDQQEGEQPLFVSAADYDALLALYRAKCGLIQRIKARFREEVAQSNQMRKWMDSMTHKSPRQ